MALESDNDRQERELKAWQDEQRDMRQGYSHEGTGEYRTWPAQRKLPSGEWVRVDEIENTEKGEAA